MNPKLNEKIMESLAAVLPITAIVLIAGVISLPIDSAVGIGDEDDE